MAPIRCPVSCASTKATWNRQSSFRETPEAPTLTGFFSVGVFRPFSEFEPKSSLPASSLDFAAQLKTAIRNLRSHSMVRSDTGLPLGPILPARRSRMNRSQSLRDSVSGFRSRPRNRRNIVVAARSDL